MTHRSLVFLIVFITTGVYADPVSIVASENAYCRIAGGDRDESENLEARRSYTTRANNDRLTYLRFDIASIAAQITQASDIVSAALTVHLTDARTGEIPNFYVSALLDGVNETTWTAVMVPADRPHGTETVSASEGITVTPPLGSVSIAVTQTGDLSIPLSASDLFALLQADTNNEITLVLSIAGNNAVTKFASITNTGGLSVPTLTVDLASPPAAGTVIMLGSLGGGVLVLFLLLGLRFQKRA